MRCGAKIVEMRYRFKPGKIRIRRYGKRQPYECEAAWEIEDFLTEKVDN